MSELYRQSRIQAARVDSAIRLLRLHIERGAEIGGISGVAAGALIVVAAASTTGQCYTAPSLDFGGCSDGFSRWKAGKIVTGGAIVGAFVGGVLGYAYHTTLEDRRAAQCRSAPSGCP